MNEGFVELECCAGIVGRGCEKCKLIVDMESYVGTVVILLCRSLLLRRVVCE